MVYGHEHVSFKQNSQQSETVRWFEHRYSFREALSGIKASA